MPSQPRRTLWTDEAVYHVLNRGHDRQALFRDDDDRRAFLRLLSRYRHPCGFRLLHYCLMSNHYHLLLQFRDPRQLSWLGAGLQRAYVHHMARRHQFVGHLFQGRFKSVVVQRETFALSCGRSIERNPVEAGMVDRPWDYAWSSAAHYALGTADPQVDGHALYDELAPRPPAKTKVVAGVPSRRGPQRRGSASRGMGDRGRGFSGAPGAVPWPACGAAARSDASRLTNQKRKGNIGSNLCKASSFISSTWNPTI